MDQTAARDALVTAFQALAAVAPLAALRQALHRLIDDQDDLDQAPPSIDDPSNRFDTFQRPDMTTPPTHGAIGGADMGLPPIQPRAEPPTLTERPMRRLPPKAAPAKGAPSTKGKNDVQQWLDLRARVQAEMARCRMDIEALAGELGYTFHTLENSLKKRSPPSTAMEAKLAAFAAGAPSNGAYGPEAPEAPNGAASSEGPPGATVGPANGQLAHCSLAPLAEAALKALKRKRHAVALTAASLAETIGIATGELDAAIAGQPIPPQAAERLAAWAAG